MATGSLGGRITSAMFVDGKGTGRDKTIVSRESGADSERRGGWSSRRLFRWERNSLGHDGRGVRGRNQASAGRGRRRTVERWDRDSNRGRL